jgi:hypothetical protein
LQDRSNARKIQQIYAKALPGSVGQRRINAYPGCRHRDMQALTKARRLSRGIFCWRACLRQAARFCRNAFSLSRIALRVAGSAMVRSGFIPVTGAVGLGACPCARLATGAAAAIKPRAINTAKDFMGVSPERAGIYRRDHRKRHAGREAARV